MIDHHLDVYLSECATHERRMLRVDEIASALLSKLDQGDDIEPTDLTDETLGHVNAEMELHDREIDCARDIIRDAVRRETGL